MNFSDQQSERLRGFKLLSGFVKGQQPILGSIVQLNSVKLVNAEFQRVGQQEPGGMGLP